MCFVVLAVQNLEATGIVPKDQRVEWAALGGSLSMMSKGAFGSHLCRRTLTRRLISAERCPGLVGVPASFC